MPTKKLLLTFICLLHLCFTLTIPTPTHAANVLPIAPAQESYQPTMLMTIISENAVLLPTITWQDTTLNPQTFLEISPTNKNKPQRFTPTVTTLTTTKGNVYVYTVTFTPAMQKPLKIKPNKKYHFRLNKNGLYSPYFQIKMPITPTQQNFTALIFGDAQSINYNVWGQTANQAYEKNPHANFFINMGDLVDNGERYSEWENWHAGGKTLLTQLPLAPVCGNHETYSATGTFIEPLPYLTLLPTPNNGPSGLKRHAYSFRYGNARFFILDTQAGELAAIHPDLLPRQAQWLEQELAQTAEPWKIVLMHRSPLSISAETPLNQIGRYFVPLFDKYQVDIVCTAHTHVNARTAPLLGGEPSSTNSGTIYLVTGRSGTKTYPNNQARPSEIFFLNPLEQPNYSVLTVSKEQLKLQAFHQNGEQFDELLLTKK